MVENADNESSFDFLLKEFEKISEYFTNSSEVDEVREVMLSYLGSSLLKNQSIG